MGETKIKPSDVEFHDNNILSTGRPARGRGSWMFVFGKRDYDDVSEAVTCPLPYTEKGQPTFAEAKKWAREEAVRRGVTLVGICS